MAGYPQAADSGSSYRDAYAQSHVDRQRGAWEQANIEAFGLYDTESARLAALDAVLVKQLKEANDYVAELDKLMLEAPKAAKSSGSEGSEGSDATKVQVAKIQALKDIAIAEGQRSSEASQRKLDARAAVDKTFDAPNSSVVAINALGSSLSTQKGLVTTPEQLGEKVKAIIQDDRYTAAIAGLSTPAQKKDAAIKLAASVSASLGMAPEAARKAVADATGFNPADLDPEFFAVEKEMALKQTVKDAEGGWSGATARADLAKLGGTSKETPTPSTQLTNAQAYLESPNFRVVRKAIDAGQFEEGEVVVMPTADGHEVTAITPELMAEYAKNRRLLHAPGVELDAADDNYFTPLFISRAKARADAVRVVESTTKDIEKVRADSAALKPPTIEDVRARQSQLYEPVSGREKPVGEVTAKNIAPVTGEEATRKAVELPSRLTDQQRATAAATRAALTLARTPGWDKEESDAQTKALQIRGLVSQGLAKKDVYAHAADLSDGDASLRDDIFARVIAYDIQTEDAKKFKPVETPAPKVLPSGKEETPEQRRRRLALEALQGMSTEGI